MKRKWPLVVWVVFVYWTVGFYPFRWSLPFKAYINAAQSSAEGRWQFSEPGIAKTTAAPEWLAEAIKHSSLQVILEIKPAYQDQSGPARIFSISQNPYYQNVMIGQEGADLVLRLRTSQTSLSGMPSYQIADVFAHAEWQRLEVLIRPGELQIQINGAPCISTKLPARALLAWASDCVPASN